jgi:hypothetical protein
MSKPDFKAMAKGCVNPILLTALTERHEQYLFEGFVRWGLVEQHITERVAAALQSAYEAGVAAERERCAGIAEAPYSFDISVWVSSTKSEMVARIATAIAAAIRSQKP